MANSDISGQITDSFGRGMAFAQVYLWREDLAGAGGVVASTTADSNGNFAFTAHPDGSGSSESWHVAAEDPNADDQLLSAYGVTASLPTSVNSQFDMSITSTSPSPVGTGETLTVDASLSNSGTDSDTQTITLDIDNGVGQVDSSLEAAQGGASKTVPLSWAVPSGQTKQDYQATVSSADDTASQTVEVGLTAPDAANIYAQYDATTLALSHGDTVSTWPTKQGNGPDLSANGSPTYRASGINGYPAVDYSGDYHQSGGQTANQPNTFYMVIDPDTTSGQKTLFGRTSKWHYVRIDGGNNYAYHNGDFVGGVSGATFTSPYVFTFTSDGNNTSFRVNGTYENQNGPGGSNAIDGITIGARNDGDDKYDGSVGEFLVYDTAHSDATKDDVEQYLADKWGITL